MTYVTKLCVKEKNGIDIVLLIEIYNNHNADSTKCLLCQARIVTSWNK